MRGFNHATILSPSFHGLHKERLHNGLLLFVTPKTDQKFRGVLSEKLGEVFSTLPETLFQTKVSDFPALFQT